MSTAPAPGAVAAAGRVPVAADGAPVASRSLARERLDRDLRRMALLQRRAALARVRRRRAARG